MAGVVAIGDARPYNTALVVLDPEALHGRGFGDESVVAQVAEAIATANKELSRVEQIKRFKILPVFWEPGADELTLTMKLRRKPIGEKYAEDIEALYAEPMAKDVHEPVSAA